MSQPGLSTPLPSPPWPSSPNGWRLPVRDRDYLLDRHGVIFKVIGDVHPDSHYLGYVKYHPDGRGDRRLFGKTYRQNTVVSKSFGILADRPECYVYSPVLGCVITGLPRHDVATHYSCRQALAAIHDDPVRVDGARAGGDLLAIVARIIDSGVAEKFGVSARNESPSSPAPPRPADTGQPSTPRTQLVWVRRRGGAELVLQGPDRGRAVGGWQGGEVGFQPVQHQRAAAGAAACSGGIPSKITDIKLGSIR